MPATWSVEELKRELRRFERDLRAAGLRPTSVATYVGRSEIFVRWLAGYVPGQVGAPESPPLLTDVAKSRSASVEIRTLPEFRETLASGEGVVVIVGRPSGRVVVHDISCPFLTEESFSAKVDDGGGRTGRYFWAPGRDAAMAEFGAQPCRHPADHV